MFLGLGQQHIVAIGAQFFDWLNAKGTFALPMKTSWKLCARMNVGSHVDKQLKVFFLGGSFRGRRTVLEEDLTPAFVDEWEHLKTLLIEAGAEYTASLKTDEPSIFDGCAITMK